MRHRVRQSNGTRLSHDLRSLIQRNGSIEHSNGIDQVTRGWHQLASSRCLTVVTIVTTGYLAISSSNIHWPIQAFTEAAEPTRRFIDTQRTSSVRFR